MESGVSENAVSGHIQLIKPGESACFAVSLYIYICVFNVSCSHQSQHNFSLNYMEYDDRSCICCRTTAANKCAVESLI